MCYYTIYSDEFFRNEQKKPTLDKIKIILKKGHPFILRKLPVSVSAYYWFHSCHIQDRLHKLSDSTVLAHSINLVTCFFFFSLHQDHSSNGILGIGPPFFHCKPAQI
uniref:Uncharacterized protein n=1 Tax=Micrurus paraensis TaxID=1970185 RepID=A0A2D4KAS8_9SAUR